jgi:hypothetical protein
MAGLSLASTAWAGNVFIDPTAAPGGNGSFAAPFDSWSDVRFSSSDDYFQKCGTKATLDFRIVVDASGTQNNKIVIGPYYNDGGSPALELYSADSKPIVDRGTKAEGNVFDLLGDHINLSNFELRRGEATIRIKGANNTVEYCVIGEDAWFGIRVVGSEAVNNIIRRNIIDTKSDIYNSGTDATANSVDGITLASGSSHSKIYGNFFGAWDHTAIEFERSDYNEVYNNTAPNPTSVNMRFFAIDLGSDYNKIHHNWIENMDARSQFGAGVHNEAYKNIFYKMTDNHRGNQGACVWFQGIAGGISKYNKAYNNIIYGVQREGVAFNNIEGNGDVQYNEVYKNVILNSGLKGTPSIWVDNNTYGILNQTIRDNHIFNDNGVDKIKHRGTIYTTSTYNSINSYDVIDNNKWQDPGFKDAENGDFSFRSDSPLWSAGIEEVQVNIITEEYLLKAGVSKLMPPILRIAQQ